MNVFLYRIPLQVDWQRLYILPIIHVIKVGMNTKIALSFNSDY